MNNNTKRKLALVTGSGEGIGKGLAFEVARRGYDVILASLPTDHLTTATEELRAKYPDVIVYPYGVDLCQQNTCEDLFKWADDQDLVVDLLINNVGLGALGTFDNHPMKFYLKMIQLNCETMTSMIHAFLPHLKKSDDAAILNVGSMAGFNPIPYKAVYSATKAYTINLSKALGKEFEQYGIRVSAVCPGAVITNPKVQDRIEKAGFFGKISAFYPDELAVIAINKTMKGRHVIVPGIFNQIFNFVLKILPYNLRMSVLSRAFGDD